MGDRANVAFRFSRDHQESADKPLIKETPGYVWMYTHWGGSDLDKDVRIAIQKATPRWGDPTYATRIALRDLLAPFEDEHGAGVGFGISDNEYSYVLVVDFEAKLVAFHNLPAIWWKNEPGDSAFEWTFDEYLDPANEDEIHQRWTDG